MRGTIDDLSKVEKSQIRTITQSPQWQSFVTFAESVIQKIKNENTTEETEWYFLRKSLLKEGRVMGIQEFFQELTNLNNE